MDGSLNVVFCEGDVPFLDGFEPGQSVDVMGAVGVCMSFLLTEGGPW